MKLLAALKEEVGTLAESHEEDARSIASFVDASAHEATRAEKKPKLVEASLNGLTASVESFEASHPKLAETVNQIAVVLSNMGIIWRIRVRVPTGQRRPNADVPPPYKR